MGAIFTDMTKVARLAVEGEAYGQLMVNVFHYYCSTTEFNSTVADELIAAWQFNVQPNYLICLPTAYTLQRFSARSAEAGIWSSESAVGLPTAGHNGADVSGTQLAGIVSWKSGVPSRRARGRTYLPCLPEDSSDLSQVTPTQIGHMNDFANSALAFSGDSHDFQMVVLSDPDFVLAATPHVPPITSPRPPLAYEIVTFISRRTPGTVRRRRIGVGR